jgi:Double zinc ribbon
MNEHNGKGRILMSDLQTKIGDGITKIQGSLQQGKQKLATAQEISQLKKTSAEAAAKRLELIVALGEEVYELVRRGELGLTRLTVSAQAIQEQDSIIYRVSKSISEINDKNEDSYTCECGAPLNANAKFCGGCGQKVEIQNKVHVKEYTLQCLTCGEMNPSGSDFCGCCGNTIQ